ncbi:hypothetical protein LCGC14_2289710, partial [marine sediment metagenome]
MADVLTSTQRSFNMSRIRSKNTGPERAFKKELRSAGISGFIEHPKYIEGKPDFYFPKHKLAVFIDGCFWHACPSCFQEPDQNNKFWMKKITQNIRRDKMVEDIL